MQRRLVRIVVLALAAAPAVGVVSEGSAAAEQAFGSSTGKIMGVVSVPSKTIMLKAPECTPLFKGAVAGDVTVTNVWESAKLPALKGHCDKLQFAVNAFHDGRWTAAIDYAAKAELDTPGQPGPWVIRGEAYARWGKIAEALKAFETAKGIHPRALDDAETLDDYGAVLVAAGKIDEARKVYRSLLPRVFGSQGLCGALSECDDAGRAYLTAGVLALELGAPALDEAVAILREARTKSAAQGDVRRIASLALALALDRRGDVDQARELATDVVKTRGVPAEIPAEVLVRFPFAEEGSAMRALGLEVSDATAAAEAWRAYISAAGDKRPWTTHAKQHLAKVDKAGGIKPAAKPPRPSEAGR